jgi:hypothetical protein
MHQAAYSRFRSRTHPFQHAGAEQIKPSLYWTLV